MSALEAAAGKIRSGDLEGGRTDLRRILEKNPSDSTAIRFLGHAHVAEGSYAQAEREYTRALALDPGNTAIRNDLRDARLLQKSDTEVLASARKRMRTPAQTVDALGVVYRITQRSRDNVDAYLALAEGFLAADKPVQVAASLQEALDRDDGSLADGIVARAQSLAGRRPGVGLTHNLLGRALLSAGRTDESIDSLRTAVDIAPGNASYATDLAGAYARRAEQRIARSDLVGANADIEAGRTFDPRSTVLDVASARVAMARADRDLSAGKITRAMRRLRSAGLNPPDDDALRGELSDRYVRIAGYFKGRGEDGQALANYERALSLDPTSKSARQNVGTISYSKGIAARDAGDLDGAIRHLQRAFDTYRADDNYRTDLADAFDRRGKVYLGAGKLTEAIADFEEGLALDPANNTLNDHYADAIAQQNSA